MPLVQQIDKILRENKIETVDFGYYGEAGEGSIHLMTISGVDNILVKRLSPDVIETLENLARAMLSKFFQPGFEDGAGEQEWVPVKGHFYLFEPGRP